MPTFGSKSSEQFMPNTSPLSIDDVIVALDEIIDESMQRNDPLGYFAVLYRKVTAQVKDDIDHNNFKDNGRMKELDVVFAQRYLDAYFAFQNNGAVSNSWRTTFAYSRDHEAIVLQHLLLGMNAHINLDLGIAAAQVSVGKDIMLLKPDFDKINGILSKMVGEVQDSLASIWPFLKRILTKTGKFDDYLVDFSMEIARDGAWDFALQLAGIPGEQWNEEILKRDARISKIAEIITHPKTAIQLILWMIRLGERGNVRKKMERLMTP